MQYIKSIIIIITVTLCSCEHNSTGNNQNNANKEFRENHNPNEYSHIEDIVYSYFKEFKDPGIVLVKPQVVRYNNYGDGIVKEVLSKSPDGSHINLKVSSTMGGDIILNLNFSNDGLVDSTFKLYFTNNTIFIEANFDNGIPIGDYCIYYPNGNLKAYMVFSAERSSLVYTEIYYNPEGTIFEVINPDSAVVTLTDNIKKTKVEIGFKQFLGNEFGFINWSRKVSDDTALVEIDIPWELTEEGYYELNRKLP